MVLCRSFTVVPEVVSTYSLVRQSQFYRVRLPLYVAVIKRSWQLSAHRSSITRLPIYCLRRKLSAFVDRSVHNRQSPSIVSVISNVLCRRVLLFCEGGEGEVFLRVSDRQS